MTQHVVIIGAGYGGLRAIEKLAKDEDIKITLIDENPYHYMQTEVYGYIAGKYDICDITIDIANWCKGFSSNITFIHDKAIDIIPQKKQILTTRDNIFYDQLIIVTGAKTNFPTFIDGLRQNSYGVKVLDRAYELKAKFESLIYKKIRNSDEQKFNVIIGGAGLSGVEIAAEMAYIAQKITSGSGLNQSDISITLIEAYDTILFGMDSYIIDKTTKRLESLGIDIRLNSFISSVNQSSVTLQNGDMLEHNFMIFTGGIKVSEFDTNLNVEKNKLNEYLNIPQDDSIYAIGDCAQIEDKHKNILPPTAQIAEQCAKNVAKNILAKIHNKPLEKFHGYIDGVFVALGGQYAVGTIFGLKLKGYLAYILKKIITKMYHYGLLFRLNNGYKLRK